MARERRNSNEDPVVPRPALRRLPIYFGYLQQQQEKGIKVISSSTIAEDLNLHPVQVRKDMALTRVSGKPRTGFRVDDLIEDLARMLDYGNLKNAAVVGAGHLGSALLNYEGFEGYGLSLIAAFDDNTALHGKKIGQAKVYPTSDIKRVVEEQDIIIGVITVPMQAAQESADLLISSGIKAIWNFAPIQLTVPDDVILQNENIAASLSVLSKRLIDLQNQTAEGDDQPTDDD